MHDSHDKLHRVIGIALRDLPPRRAPATLEMRVRSELERRALLPWWRSSFTDWPASARFAFVLLCAALVGSTILGGVSAVSSQRPVAAAASLLLAWVQPLLAILSAAAGVGVLLLRLISPLWLYAALALGAALYVALFGLGAAAYRTLYLPASMTGDRS